MHTNDQMTYEEFGRKFFETAVTEERVAGAVAQIAGDEFEMGPMGQGPGKIAKVTAKVKVKEPVVTRNLADTISFAIRIPLAIDLIIDLLVDKQRFTVDGHIALRASAHAVEPLNLVIDVSRPRASDITVDVSSTSLRGEVLRIIAGVDGEIRRFISKYVAGEISNPKSQGVQTIDVAHLIDSTWEGI